MQQVAAAAAVGGVAVGLVRCIRVVQQQEQQCEHTILLLDPAVQKPWGKTNLMSLQGQESLIFLVERGWVLLHLCRHFLTKTQISAA